MTAPLTQLMRQETRGKQGPKRRKGMRVGRHNGAWAIMDEGSEVVEGGFPSERHARARKREIENDLTDSNWFLYRMPAQSLPTNERE